MEIITLNNGFRICLEPRPWLKSCAIGLFIGSGSRYETPQTHGISHCIEHMLFKGTETLSARQIAEIDDDTGGSLNAYTSRELTCVHARVLSCHVEKILSLIADMVLHPALSAEELETEKSVILEEYNSSKDNPDDLCMETFYESYWQGDFLGKKILGTRETIRSMSTEMIRAHMEKFYVPERMVISICGAFDRDAVCALCEKEFGALQNIGNPIRYTSPQMTQFIRTVPKDLQQNVLTLGFPGMPLEDDRSIAYRYALSVLGGTTSSRLFQRIREQMGLVYSIDAFHLPFMGAGVSCVSMALAAGKETAALEETMRLCRELPQTVTESELKRAKMQSIASITMAFESSVSSASRVGMSILIRDSVLTEDEVLQKNQDVTLDDVRSAAQDMFLSGKVSLSVVGKTKTEEDYRSILRSAF